MPNILFFIDYPQDLDLLLPLMRHLGLTARFGIRVWVTRHALDRSPRILDLLRKSGIQPKVIGRKRVEWGWVSIKKINAIITASESTLKPHRTAHHLVLRANRQSIATFTLQHGFENIGLSYFDSNKVDFASREIWVWGEKFISDPQICASVRERCKNIGLAKDYDCEAAVVPNLNKFTRVVSVFENLHWNRYTSDYREMVLKNIKHTVTKYPKILFLIKPHHDERWLGRRGLHFGKPPANLIFADPNNTCWQPFTAPALIKISDLVFTTPSTVALDAVVMNKPVCIIGGEVDLKQYEPLKILRSAEEWDQAIEGLQESAFLDDLRTRGSLFRRLWINSENGLDNMQKRLDEILTCSH